VKAEKSQNESAVAETPDYTQFKARIRARSGIDLNLYKQQQMHRRLLGLVERVQAKDFLEYYSVLERDPQEYALFLDRMTINVSELFRNPEKWQELKEKILPPMLAKKPSLKVWSAGCSYGAEPYTLAILLNQIAPHGKHCLHASDLDRKIVARAQEGKFTPSDVKNLEASTLTRYFSRLPSRSGSLTSDMTPAYQVNADLRAQVTFRAHNLLADTFETGYDLICCRNVVIYFTDRAKERLYTEFYRALAPGGVLFVGGTERIFNYQELGFSSPLSFFYRREG
jgi:chemotaxis protein methyltransferase CheR